LYDDEQFRGFFQAMAQMAWVHLNNNGWANVIIQGSPCDQSVLQWKNGNLKDIFQKSP
jgi:hypothetical protein